MVLNKNNFIAVTYICILQLSTTDRQGGVLPTKVIFLGEISLRDMLKYWIQVTLTSIFFFFFANPSYQIFLIFYKPQYIGCWNHSLSHEVSFTSKIQLWDMFGFTHTILWYTHICHMVHIISLYTDYWPFLTYHPI